MSSNVVTKFVQPAIGKLLKILSKQKRSLNLVVTTLTIVSLIVLGSGVEKNQISLFNPQPGLSQSVSPRDVWRQVYEQLPNLPLENQYISKETGKVASDNTLVSRLINYHVYVKGRAPNYRLDWKLTLADYLGVNDIMPEEAYPGYENLRKNPIEGDRAAIQRLNRQQRNVLIQTLVNAFTSNYSAPAATTPLQPSTEPSPTDRENSPPPRL